MNKKQTIDTIAQEILNTGTLEKRGMDSLDFRDLHVSQIKKALEAAYEAGKTATKFRHCK